MNSEAAVLALINSDYKLTIEEAEAEYDTNSQTGLDEDEAKNRLEYQCKKRCECKKESELMKLAKNLIGIHNLPLWFGSGLCMLVYLSEKYILLTKEFDSDNFYISVGLMIFVFSFGIFSYYMDAKCSYYVESCRDSIPNRVIVIREGIYKWIRYEQLVVGDLVSLRDGQQLLADVKIVTCSGVKINVAALEEREAYFYERFYHNPKRLFQSGDILLASTFISSGFGIAIVIRTTRNYVSQCKWKLSTVQVEEEKRKRYSLNPLTLELKQFLHYLSFLSIATSGIYSGKFRFNPFLVVIHSVIAIYHGYTWLRAVMLFIVLYVALITEALIPALNVAKAQITKELVNKNCYIQNIEALETLGTTSIICTNKTGVLTTNFMIVSNIWLENHLYPSYRFIQLFKDQELNEPMASLVRCCSLCVFACFAEDKIHTSPFKRNCLGKPSEVALLRYMEAFTGSLERYRKAYQLCISIAYNASHKYSFSVYRLEGGEQYLICVKGQPETLIEHCKSIVTRDGVKPFTKSHKTLLLEQCVELGKKKERVLGIVQAFSSFQNRFPMGHQFTIVDFENILHCPVISFQFIGLVSFQNPVRLSVPEAIAKCRQAGIKVMMVTSDHPETSLSVAKVAGIILNKDCAEMNEERIFRNHNGLIFSDSDLKKLKNRHLKELIVSGSDLVFARISSDSKQRIVKCGRDVRAIVAATGVRTDDLAIFDRSHVRISLGQYGSDILKHNSDVILLDDNFASIVSGIEYGRILFANVKKSLIFMLSSKPSELLPFLISITFAIPEMTSIVTLLLLDLLGDNLTTISLGYEKGESNVMLVKPRHVKSEKIVDFKTIQISLFYGMFEFLAGLFGYVVVMCQNGFHFNHLVSSREQWYSKAVNDFPDSYGQEWTYADRQKLELVCQSVYFTTTITARIAVLLSCRTRRDSILANLCSNRMVNFAIFFILLGSIFLSYYPPVDYTKRLYPLKLSWWFVGSPFFLLILIVDECRKWILRNYPTSYIGRIFSY